MLKYFQRISSELLYHVISFTNDIPLYERNALWVDVRLT